jgi:uncharacterized metal-binding protein
MPSGRTHDRITLWTLPIAGGLTLLTTRSSTLTLVVCAGFLFGGLMLGPDLDVHSVHFKRWGWFRWIWLPYQGSLRHRSPYSHAPITGTLVRVGYLLAWLGITSCIVLTLVNQLWHLGWTWSTMASFLGRSLHHHQAKWIALILGLELGSLSHYVADWVVSTYKQYKIRGWKAVWKALKPTSPQARKRKVTSSKETGRSRQSDHEQ